MSEKEGAEIKECPFKSRLATAGKRRCIVDRCALATSHNNGLENKCFVDYNPSAGGGVRECSELECPFRAHFNEIGKKYCIKDKCRMVSATQGHPSYPWDYRCKIPKLR